MTDPGPETRRSRSFLSPLGEAASYLIPLLISAAAMIWCSSATGPTLGLFLGGLLLATLVAPPLAVWERPSRIWLPVLGVTLGIALVWATSLRPADLTTWEWIRCCLVLATYVIALSGIATLLNTIRFPRSPAAGLTMLVGLLWLSWPVWLSPWLTQGMADWLVPGDPVFAINAALQHLGTWDRAPLAYQRLTVLNQDVPYRLLASVAPACIIHAIIGGGCLLLAVRRTKHAKGSQRAIRG